MNNANTHIINNKIDRNFIKYLIVLSLLVQILYSFLDGLLRKFNKSYNIEVAFNYLTK